MPSIIITSANIDSITEQELKRYVNKNLLNSQFATIPKEPTEPINPENDDFDEENSNEKTKEYKKKLEEYKKEKASYPTRLKEALKAILQEQEKQEEEQQLTKDIQIEIQKTAKKQAPILENPMTKTDSFCIWKLGF